MKNRTTPLAALRTALAAVLLTAGFSSTAQAQTANPGEAAITYAGTVDNKLVFAVSFENKNAAPFTLEITDGAGFRFFSDRFAQTGFRRFFALETEGVDKTVLTIQLSTKEGVQKQSFDISAGQRVVDELSVTKR